jgi:hypothetical protein
VRRRQAVVLEASAAARRALVPEQLASFRDIGNWLSPGLAGGL